MPGFVQIPPAFLQSIATDEERIPTLYFHANPLIRRFFWMRLRLLHELALRHSDRRRPCLDFGAGGGVFLPTLSGCFERVVSLDLVTKEARAVVAEFALPNVDVVEADATRVTLDRAPFGTIVAADVLEHFEDLEPPTALLRNWLGEGGVLLTSLPTEDRLYDSLRRIQRVEKPADHYHRAVEVERHLASNGFLPLARRYVPLRLPIGRLYHATAWTKR